MLDSMRKPFFIVALVAIFLAVFVELGSITLLKGHTSADTFGVSPTGKAIPAMAFLDGLIFFATVIIAIALLIPERVQSKVQGLVTLVFSILLLLGCIAVIFADIALLILMVSLLMSAPFGTLAYLAVWADFPTGQAQAALTVIMTLKMVFAIFLVLAHQRFLQNKGLVLIIITSFVSNLVLAFLYGFPVIIVSITDDIGAIIVCVLAIIWGVVYLIGGIVSVVKVIV